MPSRRSTRAAIAAVLLSWPAAHGVAHAQELFQFRVDTATGKAKQLRHTNGHDSKGWKRIEPAGGARLAPAPRLRSGGSGLYRDDAGNAILYDRPPNVRFRLPMSGDRTSWSPWSIEREGLLVFVWRVATPGPHGSLCRQILTAAEVRGARVLWQREGSCLELPAAGALNDRAFVADGLKQVEIIEIRTGKTLRALAKGTRSFSMTDLPDGLLVEAGDDLHLLDRATGDSRWRVGKREHLISWTPLPQADRALLQTYHGVTTLVDTRAGKIVWQKASSSSNELWVVGDRIYEPWLEGSLRHSVVRLIERRLADGAVVGNVVVQNYKAFAEIQGTSIIGVQDGQIDIETEWGNLE